MTSDVHPPIESSGEQGESIWIRGLFMLLFVLIYSVAELVVVAVALIQFGWVVFSSEHNPRLARFGASLSRFVYQTMQYWMFNSEEKPFPFGEWPSTTQS